MKAISTFIMSVKDVVIGQIKMAKTKSIFHFKEIRKTSFGSFKVKDLDGFARTFTESKRMASKLKKKIEVGHSVGIFEDGDLVWSIKRKR